MKDKVISDIGEKELIRILLEKRDKLLTEDNEDILASYSDDAALVENTSKYTVVSTDTLIEHSDFPEAMTHYQMGAKAVTVNVSDILAMNAKPDSILMSIALPDDTKLEEFLELTDGILDKCMEYDMKLIGGDISHNDEIMLTGTCIGKTDCDVKLQSGIVEGNLIGVSGELGSVGAALDLIYGVSVDVEDREDILKALYLPDVPLELSEKLRNNPKLTTSMTDITDGLAVELGHLHDKNPGIGFEIYYDKLPYLEGLETIAEANNKKLTEYLLHVGEEFELLLTLDKKEYDKTELEEIHIIGKTNNNGRITLVNDSVIEEIEPKGYEHI